MMAFTCGSCRGRHESVEVARACHAPDAEVGACHWMVQVPSEDGPVVVDCGAEAVFDDRGWRCAAGHEHVNAEARAAEGWDHAEEWGEAMAMARAGVEPRTMSGHVVTGPRSFAEGWG